MYVGNFLKDVINFQRTVLFKKLPAKLEVMRVVLYQLPKIWIGALWKMICRALDRTIKWSSRWLGVVVRWDGVGFGEVSLQKEQLRCWKVELNKKEQPHVTFGI